MSLPAPASLRPVLAAVKAKPCGPACGRPLTAAAVRRLISAAGTAPQERLTRPQDQQSGENRVSTKLGAVQPGSTLSPAATARSS